jgi:hypothetical protein
MRRVLQSLMVCLLFLGVQASAQAQGTLIPAGTLLRCTLDEPNFSSKTADVGDPVICHLSALRQFGHSVFPRGAYLGGHLESDKEPGHFVGKGYLKIEFDRIGLPDSDIPVPAKIIAARGYKVDKKGDIVGKGHATRDTVEWLIPPLWPWKILTLPAKGPRPTLKGEEPITVRLMDDIDIPALSASSRYNRPPAPAAYHSQGARKPVAMQSADPAAKPAESVTDISLEATPPAPLSQMPAMAQPAVATEPAVSVQAEMSANPRPVPLAETGAVPVILATEVAQVTSAVSVKPTRVRMIAMKSDKVYAVTSYHINGGSVSYVLAEGGRGSADVTAVDWRKTSQMNSKSAGSDSPLRTDSRTY